MRRSRPRDWDTLSDKEKRLFESGVPRRYWKTRPWRMETTPVIRWPNIYKEKVWSPPVQAKALQRWLDKPLTPFLIWVLDSVPEAGMNFMASTTLMVETKALGIETKWKVRWYEVRTLLSLLDSGHVIDGDLIVVYGMFQHTQPATWEGLRSFLLQYDTVPRVLVGSMDFYSLKENLRLFPDLIFNAA